MSIKSTLSKYSITSVFHFTDKSNLKSIEKYGLQSLKNIFQRGIEVSRFGAESMSHELDRQRGLDKYVHLAFTNDHPMYYVAKNRGNIINPIWLEIDISVLFDYKTLFCDRVANQTNSNLFKAESVSQNINFSDMFYGGTFEAKKEARKAEILIFDKIETNLIKGITYGK